VWERAFDGFTEDWYATGGASCNNCANMNTDSRVARGGVFDYHPKYLRAAYRGSYYPTNPYNNSIGFRCARSP
jgi:formylglycine-generating enzyme required for sulfatase activity